VKSVKHAQLGNIKELSGVCFKKGDIQMLGKALLNKIFGPKIVLSSSSLIVQIQMNGQIPVFASDFVSKVLGGCGTKTYSVSKDGTNWSSSTNLSSLSVTYTCSNLGNNTMRIRVVDVAGQDLVTVNINVQDNQGVC
jgi:hypothetical protein